MNLIQQNIQKLRDDLHSHNHSYYVLDKTVISDFEFDSKLKELKILLTWLFMPNTVEF